MCETLGTTGNLTISLLTGERWASSLLWYAIWTQIARTCEKMITIPVLYVFVLFALAADAS